ncbi:hypothetical protein OAO01_04750 [Oligoflexia bacterium]|nr:hypothetical protein [Oligoflexia bacterium]
MFSTDITFPVSTASESGTPGMAVSLCFTNLVQKCDPGTLSDPQLGQLSLDPNGVYKAECRGTCTLTLPYCASEDAAEVMNSFFAD